MVCRIPFFLMTDAVMLPATNGELVAMRATHWSLRVVTPDATAIVHLPKAHADKPVWGFFPADMLDGATAFVSGAPNAFARDGYYVVAHPTFVTK